MSQVDSSVIRAAVILATTNVTAAPKVPPLVSSVYGQIKDVCSKAATVSLEVIPSTADDAAQYNAVVLWKKGAPIRDVMALGAMLKKKNDMESGLLDSNPQVEYLPKYSSIGCIIGIYDDDEV